MTKRPALLDHVFVASDFSTGAGHAIARAARLPLADRAKVTIVHVLSDRISKRLRASAEKLARSQLAQAMKSLRKIAASLGRREIEVSSELCEGRPYVEIIRHARSVDTDLIVLGRHGLRPVKDMFIGSTADRVIRAGDLPVLVVSRKASGAYHRPLVAVALEDSCRSLVTVALRVIGPDVASARMIHAYHVPFEGLITPGVEPGDMTDLRKEYRGTAAGGVAKLEASVRDLGVRFQTVIARGDPRTAIMAEADRCEADLLAVGTHGRSGLAHALIGSVAEWVIQSAACDVLVARPVRVSFELP